MPGDTLAQLREENDDLRRAVSMLRGELDAVQREHNARRAELANAIEYQVEAVGHGRQTMVKATTPEQAASTYVDKLRTVRWMQPGLLLRVANPSMLRDAGSVYEVLGTASASRRVRLAYALALLPALPGELPPPRAIQPGDIVAGARIQHRYFAGELVVLRLNDGWAQVQSKDGETWIEIERLCDEMLPL